MHLVKIPNILLLLTLALVLPALGTFGLSASAASTWLVLLYGKSFDANGSVGAALEKIEMPDMDTCKVQGKNWIQSKSIKRTSDIGYHCVEGK